MRHNWEYKKIGDVSKSDLGKTLNQSKDTGELYPYLCAINIQWDEIDLSTIKQAKFDEDEIERFSVRKGDLLICEGGDTGRSAIWDREPMLYQNALHRVRFDKYMNARFALMYLLHLKKIGDIDTKYSKGVTIKHLVKSSLSSIPIPIPPLPTQQAIVSELDTLSGIIAECKETLKDYDALEQSIFYDMFGDPVKNEKGWEVKKLGEICDVITKGTTPTTVGFQFLNEGINFVKVESFEEGKLNKTKFAYISDECHEALRRSQLLENDILICIAGATVGKLALVTKDILPANTNQACCIIRLKKEFAVSRKYIFSILQSDYIKRFIESLKKGVAQPNLTLEHVRNFSIPNVPINLQQTFASKIEAIEQMKAETKEALQEAETLFQARMDYWFG